MTQTLINTCRLLLGLGAAACAAAAAETPRQYDIELLVFEHLVNTDNGEVWPVDYSEWLEESQPDAPAADRFERNVRWLPAGSYRLTAERNAMGRSAQYRPLAYLAWRQPVLDRANALPIEIPVERSGSGSYIDGTVRVAVERYLHLYLDLQLHTAHRPAGNETYGESYDLPEIRLIEHRRMRSKEVHYFDNPRFGVVALITPYSPAGESQP